MRKINEIFYSLQGEGYYTGTPAVFIRFSGCNLKCGFCDTVHEMGTLMTDDEIINEIIGYPSTMIVLTGGEPSLWVDEEFVSKLKNVGRFVCIETNGTCELPTNIDWVTCSPKEGTVIKVKKIDEIKVVYTGQSLDVYSSIAAKFHFLQPCSCKNTTEVIEYILEHPKWRLSLQTHKLIDIR